MKGDYRQKVRREMGRAFVAPRAGGNRRSPIAESPSPIEGKTTVIVVPAENPAWVERERQALWKMIEMHEARLAEVGELGHTETRQTSGSEEFYRALEEIERQGRRVVSLAQGKRNADWIIKSVPKRLVQEQLFHR